MEPFLDFCSAAIYAFTQIRIEWRAWQAYRRTGSPFRTATLISPQGNAESDPWSLVNGGFPPKELL
jgi:hypothetical protein